MKRLLRVACATACLLLANASISQEAGPEIRGVVVVAGTQDPLAGSLVQIRSLEESAAFPSYFVSVENDGSFVFRNVPEGQYQLTPSRPAYVPVSMAPPVTVTRGRAADTIRLALAGTGAIFGRVLDREGEPMGNVWVQALRVSRLASRTSLTSVRTTLTNDLGEYRLGWLPPGGYFVRAIHTEVKRGVVDAIATTAVQNAQPVRSNPSNRMRLGLAPDENYVPVYYPGTADPNASSEIDVRAGREIGGVNITVAPLRLASIRGAINGHPAGARVQLRLSHSPAFSTGQTATRSADQNGAFGFSDVPPGMYVVAASTGTGENRMAGRVSINLGALNENRAGITLAPVFRIAGKVSLDGHALDAATAKLLTVSLRLDPAVPGLFDSDAATIAPDGSFTIRGVLTERYAVQIAPAQNLQRLYIKSIRFGSQDVLAHGLRLEGPSQAALEIALGADAGTLEGVVVSEDARDNVAAIEVFAFPEITERHRADLHRSQPVDTSGTFRFTGLAPGNYKVIALRDVEPGAVYDPRFIRQIDELATPVRVLGAAPTAVRVRISPLRD
jgi:hypothetical protein